MTNNGSGTCLNILSAVQSCIDNGASVVSMSLGGCNPYAQAEQFYKKHSSSVLIIAAAGNSGNGNKMYPASYESVMSVAAVDINGNRASFSQYNE